MSYQPKTYRTDGGDTHVVASGGTLRVESGGTLLVESGATVTIADGAYAIGDFALAEGSLVVGNSSGVGSALVAKTAGQILVGNGTTVVGLDAKGDGKLLIGNGTTITSQTVSGSGATIALSNAGVVTISAIAGASLAAGAVTPAKSTYTGLKFLGADAVNTAGGDAEVTLTGTVIGDRVIAIFGHTKANTGTHEFLFPVVGTDFEATITVVDKIVQKQAAGDLSANSYLFLIAPAAA